MSGVADVGAVVTGCLNLTPEQSYELALAALSVFAWPVSKATADRCRKVATGELGGGEMMFVSKDAVGKLVLVLDKLLPGAVDNVAGA